MSIGENINRQEKKENWPSLNMLTNYGGKVFGIEAQTAQTCRYKNSILRYKKSSKECVITIK